MELENVSGHGVLRGRQAGHRVLAGGDPRSSALRRQRRDSHQMSAWKHFTNATGGK